MISVTNLNKSYDHTVVVDGVSIDITPTGLTSIIGPNGAGKSTLLSIISRVLNADSGQVTVDDLNVFEAPSKQVAKVLSILRQENHITARITVAELVEFGRFPHSHGRLSAACRTAVDAAIAYCELEHLRDRPIHTLSGGQRQRAHIAMVLAQDTRYVLLDEPLNNLDMAHATGVMRLLRRLANEQNKSVILVLHDINYAAAYSDRVIAMRDGAIVHDGAVSEVITPQTLNDVFGMEFQVHQIGEDRLAAYFR